MEATLAENKPKRRAKPRTTFLTHFPEVKGKTIESVEIDSIAIVIVFQDNTALSFDLDSTLSVYPSCGAAGRATGRRSSDGQRFTAVLAL
jgi:hypothetical protein